MAKLSKILLEKVEKLQVTEVLGSASKLTNPDEINKLVISKKKDDRISVAANPNLTNEQLTILLNDKVALVRMAMCYNPNLTVQMAETILAEEPDRLRTLVEYADEQLDDYLLKTVPAKNWDYYFEGVAKNKPQMTFKFLSALLTITKEKSLLRSTSARPLFRRKDLDKKTIELIEASIIDRGSSDYPLTRLILNQVDYYTEKKIKTMDWKTNSEIQQAILFRADISKKFLLEIIGSLLENTSLNYLTDNKEHLNNKDPEVLNALLKSFATKKLDTYRTSYDAFEKAKHIPLDPKLLLAVAKKMVETGKDSGLDPIVKNVSFPDEGLDIIPIKDSVHLKIILLSPNITVKRTSDLINKYMLISANQEDVLWGLAGSEVDISVKDQELFLKTYSIKSYFFQYVCRGDFADTVLKNIPKFSEYLTMPDDNEIYLMVALAKNTHLTNKQKKELFKMYSKLNHGNTKYDSMFYENITIHKNNTPEFLEELTTVNKANIWNVWTTSGSSYFQYKGKLKDKIDKIALSTPDVPKEVISGLSNKTFDAWFKYNNYEGWNNSNQMSKEVGFKYLIHFIETGSQEALGLLTSDNFIDDEYLTPEVLAALYARTQDEKYIPDSAKDIFLF